MPLIISAVRRQQSIRVDGGGCGGEGVGVLFGYLPKGLGRDQCAVLPHFAGVDGDPLQVQLAAALAQVAGADDLHGHTACVVLQGDGGADRTVGKGGHRGTGPVIPFKAVELPVEAHAHHQVVPFGLQLVPFCVVGVLIKGQVTAGVCAPELMVRCSPVC